MSMPANLDALLERTDPFGNTVLQWLIALGVVAAAYLVLRVGKAVVVHRARRLAERMSAQWATLVADVSDHTRGVFLLLVAIFFGSLVLVLPDKVRGVVQSVAIIALLVQAALWANTAIAFFINRTINRRMATDAASVTTITALGLLGKLALWVLVFLLALDNMGVDVTAMVAGLGIGGIAVALAAQNILGDLFASLCIVLDKPFVLGDFIKVGEMSGSVQHIGVKTTRVRSISGEQLVFGNTDLLQSRVQNYKRMQERRIAFSLGLTYDTPYEKVAAVPGMIREIIEPKEQVRFDRAHFKEYGDSALIYEVVYYVLVSDYAVYMDVQQAINLEIFARFEREGIAFAFPTRTLYIEGGDRGLATA